MASSRELQAHVTFGGLQVWNFIFLKGSKPEGSAIPGSTLDEMRREFEFWYPFDVRVSSGVLVILEQTSVPFRHEGGSAQLQSSSQRTTLPSSRVGRVRDVQLGIPLMSGVRLQRCSETCQDTTAELIGSELCRGGVRFQGLGPSLPGS